MTELDKAVAWQWLDTGHFRKTLPKTAVVSDWNPLFKHSAPIAQPEQPAPVRQPLTDRQAYEVIAATVGQPEPFEEIVSDGPEWAEFMAIVRAIEAKHGINAPKDKP